MTKSEAARKGGLVRSERKRAAARITLAAARLAQARKLLGVPAPASVPVLFTPAPRKDTNGNA